MSDKENNVKVVLQQVSYAPSMVSSFSANYESDADGSTGTINVSWQNPTDRTVVGVILTCQKLGDANAEIVTYRTGSEIQTGATSFTISNIAQDDSNYRLAIKAFDTNGNESTERYATVKAGAGAEITSISLDREHLDSIMTERNIEVSLSGSNFSKISTLKVQVTDGTTAQTAVDATIDTQTNTATATVTAPVPTSPTDAGKKYTVKAIIIDGEVETTSEAMAEFTVSKPARLTQMAFTCTDSSGTSLINDKNQIRVNTANKVTATFTGFNFDIRGVTKVCLLNSAKEEVDGTSVTVDLSANTSNTVFTTDITLPTIDDMYTVAVYFDDIKDPLTTGATIHVFGNPVINEILIPEAGIGGYALPIKIKGKNFTSPDVTGAECFTFTSKNNMQVQNVTIVSDTLVTAEVVCPQTVGEYDLNVVCTVTTPTGSVNANASGIVTVKEYKITNSDGTQVDVKVGDVLLNDGTWVSVQEGDDGSITFTDEQKTAAIGVVYGTKYGSPVILGLKQSSSKLQWAPNGSTGFNTNFTSIQCTPSETGSGAALTATFSGDTDGSDNWEYVQRIDPEGAADAATNYPAFNYAATYGATNNISGKYATGWYLPTIAELAEVYKNKEEINKVLTALGTDKATTIKDSYYWSSSQYASYNDSAWKLDFSDGGVSGNYKSYFNYVLVVRAFN